MTGHPVTFFQYFPTNALCKKWGFSVTSAGYSKIPPNCPYPPAEHPSDHTFAAHGGRVLNSFTFVYIPKGRGSFDSQPSQRLIVSEGCLFMVFPGVWHQYKPDAPVGWEEYWIEFEGDAANNFILSSGLESSRPLLLIRNTSGIMDLFLNIMETGQQQPHGFEYLLSAYAFQLLAIVLAEKGKQKSPHTEKNDAIQKAKRILLTDLERAIDTKQVSIELGMSYSLFRKTFKDLTGFSPNQYRMNFRLQRASQLLKSSRLQVSHIARKLGFNSVYHFSELFKKKTGCSPLEYRRKNSIIGDTAVSSWRQAE